LRRQVKPRDLVVVFFAGHGVREKGNFYLLMVNSRTNALAATALSGDALRQALGEFPCQVLLLLDACHAGAGLKNFRPATDDAARALTDDACGVAVLSAAMGHEKALALPKQGFFTAAVVEGLKAGQGVPFDRHKHLLYIHHLYSYVLEEVSHRSDDQQHPFLNLPSVVEPFPLRQVP
jgi:uncharacterized caspase-like protein